MKCPKLISAKIKMCNSDIFDGMVPNLSELNKFCECGEYHLCPFFIGSKSFLNKDSIAHSISDWNVFHRELVGA
jgi:hypothetical protein